MSNGALFADKEDKGQHEPVGRRRPIRISLPLLLPPPNQDILISLRLAESPFQISHFTPILKDFPLDLNQLELEPFSVARLFHERKGSVQVIAEADEALDVLGVRAARLSRGFELSSSKADVRVVLVRFVVLFVWTSMEVSCISQRAASMSKAGVIERTSSCGMMLLPPRSVLRCFQCG